MAQVYNKSEKKFMRTMLIGAAWMLPSFLLLGLGVRSCSQKECVEGRLDEAKIENTELKNENDKFRNEKILSLTDENGNLKDVNEALRDSLCNEKIKNAGCNCGFTTVNECKCNKNNNNNNNKRNNNRKNSGNVNVNKNPVADTLVVVHQFPETPIAEQPRVRPEAQVIVENTRYVSSRTTEIGACAEFDRVVAQRNEYSRSVQFENQK
ncbi:hypothetical protein LJC18_05340 [Lachnospiraceae bacterium OttesenSCG-928-E19]|nr:hypothetical protein [Lachnospiraceae bacterium OttesenSCG-928-E19]